MVRKSILIVAILLAICAGLAGGYVLWSRGYKEPPQVSPEVTTIAADSFMLATNYQKYMSEQEFAEYQAWLKEGAGYTENEDFFCDLSLPFNRFGYYVNRFFLQEGEVVEVIMNSNWPLGIVDVQEMSTCAVSLITIASGGAWDTYETYELPSATLERVNNDWELRYTFQAESDGYRFLQILNPLPGQIWCRYAVILKS